MNKLLLQLTIIAQDSIPAEQNPLCQIQQFTERTAINTTFDFWWDGFNILIAVIALLFSVFTFISQNKTSENTQKLSRESQRNLLLDLVRHLYRNLVITYTIKTKLDDIGYEGYPSEEHLIKLKVPMENIHLEAFYGRDKEYEVMHDLYLKLRNYNEEIDVACMHFKDTSLSQETKKRDLSTLLMKPSFLTTRIIMTIYELWDAKQVSADFNKEGYQDKVTTLMKESKAAQAAIQKILDAQQGKTNAANNTVKPSDYHFEHYANKNSCYAKLLFPKEDEWKNFADKFNHDVYVERGKNEQGGDKVYIIPFGKRH